MLCPCRAGCTWLVTSQVPLIILDGARKLTCTSWSCLLLPAHRMRGAHDWLASLRTMSSRLVRGCLQVFEKHMNSSFYGEKAPAANTLAQTVAPCLDCCFGNSFANLPTLSNTNDFFWCYWRLSWKHLSFLFFSTSSGCCRGLLTYPKPLTGGPVFAQRPLSAAARANERWAEMLTPARPDCEWIAHARSWLIPSWPTIKLQNQNK